MLPTFSSTVPRGLSPRIRPVNQGTLALQLAFRLALASKPAKEALAALQPIQQGVGSKRGMELAAHACSAHYMSGQFALLKLDATNGFQELKRAAKAVP